MKVLHISVDYPYSPLYKQLMIHLSHENRSDHVVYVPTRIGLEVPRKNHYQASNVNITYSSDFRQIDRLLYHRKRRLIQNAVERQVALTDVQVIHAHTLFSAGGVAYGLKERYGLPYVVAVRNTDVNVFFRYALHLRGFGLRVLQNACTIVFLSPPYREVVLDKFVPQSQREEIRRKSIVVPNGINDFWLDDKYRRPARQASTRDIRIAYVGAFTRNKNLVTTLRAVDALKQRGYTPHITLVGGGPDAMRIQSIAQRMGDSVTIRPWTDSQQELQGVYRWADLFLMPSLAETFGLVYAEAMSQGIPVIYSRGQGIDGYFPDGLVGHACNPLDPYHIADQVEDLLRKYEIVSAACTEAADMFRWRRIAAQYEQIYESVLANTQ